MSIQKFKPSFDEGKINKQSIPFTQLSNKTLQTCTNMEAIGLWAFLQSMPSEWNLNPAHLKKHFQVGKNKIYKLLTYLIGAKLIERHVHVCAKGTRVKTTYTVLNGSEFVDPATVLEPIAPLPQYPEVDNPEMDNRDYIKEIDIKKKDNKKEPNISANDIAQENLNYGFEDFWSIYPVRKNKIRANKIWQKKKLYKISDIICKDIKTRLTEEAQWQRQQFQFVPHPSTYLTNELWNDAIIKPSTQANSKSNGSDSLSRVIKKYTSIGTTYDHTTGNTIDPFR